MPSGETVESRAGAQLPEEPLTASRRISAGREAPLARPGLRSRKASHVVDTALTHVEAGHAVHELSLRASARAAGPGAANPRRFAGRRAFGRRSTREASVPPPVSDALLGPSRRGYRATRPEGRPPGGRQSRRSGRRATSSARSRRPARGVSRRGGPPSASIVQMSQCPSSPWESKAIRRPSGDQRGEPCDSPGPRVSWTEWVPSASASQISCASPERSDSKATRRPSGEKLGP